MHENYDMVLFVEDEVPILHSNYATAVCKYLLHDAQWITMYDDEYRCLANLIYQFKIIAYFTQNFFHI